MNEELRARPLVFVDNLANPILDPKDYAHLSRSLRLSDGAAITVGDGKGSWCLARLGQQAEVESEICSDTPRNSKTAVGFVPVKGDRTEWVVQKLTEIGVDEILILTSERAVVHWDKQRLAKKLAKLETVARQACMQARRLQIPEVSGVYSIGEAHSMRPDAAIADPDACRPAFETTTILIGPEGGFTSQEIQSVPTVVLPGHILRAETGAVVAGALLELARSSVALGGQVSL